MKAYIDNFNLIRIESKDYIYQIELKDHDIKWLKNEGDFQFFQTSRPMDLHISDTILVNEHRYPLEIGLVTLTKEFEKRFRYEGSLGYDYSKSSTHFKVFSPVAKEVYVVIDGVSYPMTYHEPIWERIVDGDFHGSIYHYRVRLVDTFYEVNDPYTNAASTLGSHILDWHLLEPIQKTPISLKNHVDAVIYEGHVRDLTIALDVKHPGVFDGLFEYCHTLKGSVLNYIKKLGMTHLQLLPIYDFDDVDDLDKDQKYNWGYNPSQYFAVEGWLSKDPTDPIDRINALRKVVNEAHRLKLGINMDVVYNHVFERHRFSYDYLVPGYFFRHDKQNRPTNASYCGNDVETRNYMVRKLIIDSLVHFAKSFQLDGFRFDLMGLLDIETMLDIEKALKAVNPSIMLYGEGWNMINEVPLKSRANMSNHALMPGYAHFNDFYRNTMKGDLHGPGLGYTMGNVQLIPKAMDAIIGSPQSFISRNQVINYVECHDNMTYFDKMVLVIGPQTDKIKLYQDFANHVIAISQGIPFYHAGQELYRTKQGVENSYKSSDEINQITWNIDKKALIQFKKILKIRKKYKVYRKLTMDENVTIERDQNMVIYTLKDKRYTLTHYLKHDEKIEKIMMNQRELLFSSQDVYIEDDNMFIDKPGVYLFIHKT